MLVYLEGALLGKVDEIAMHVEILLHLEIYVRDGRYFIKRFIEYSMPSNISIYLNNFVPFSCTIVAASIPIRSRSFIEGRRFIADCTT